MGIFFSVILGSASKVSSSSWPPKLLPTGEMRLDDSETQLVGGVDNHDDAFNLTWVKSSGASDVSSRP